MMIEFDITDQFGNKINTRNIEYDEQFLVDKFILSDDVVLELGARYGSVSCVINSKLHDKKNQVVVEPDERVWSALERNKNVNNCEFNIVKGFLSNTKMSLTNLDVYYGGYGSTSIQSDDTTIPSYTMNEIKDKYNLSFNVLVADCEGFLEQFLDENPSLYDELRLIIFESDYADKCDYDKIKDNLKMKNFIKIVEGHQNVWIKI